MSEPTKIAPGTRLKQSPIVRASFQNDLVDVVKSFQRGELGRPRETLRARHSSNQVRVRNDTGGDLPRGSVLQLGEFLLDDLSNQHLWFAATAPGSDTASKICITTRPIPDGKIDAALLGGVLIARVDVQDADDTHASPIEGETYLESGTSGLFELLSEPDGTGEQEVIVRFAQGAGGLRIFELDSVLAPGGAADVTWLKGGSGEGDVVDELNVFEGAIGTKGIAGLIGTDWVVLQMPCPSEE